MPKSSQFLRFLTGLVFLILLMRLFTLGAYPLSDTTEARYAEIGREMVVTGNWTTPQLDDGLPFWAKPPLSTWLTAASIKVFGANEFAARFPAWLLAIGVLLMTFRVTSSLYDRPTALLASTVLASTGLFFGLAGGVMTDPTLGFATTLIMVGLILGLKENSRLWGNLMFVGAGLGLLAKGPIAIVLTGFPVFIWLFWQRQWKVFFTDLPWLTGLPLMIAIALPWYLLAERATPGFLEYFFIGEHFMRFVDPHWAGDLYGSTHSAPKGMIWVFWFFSALPWTFVLLAILLLRLAGKGRDTELFHADRKWVSLLGLWMITPMLFFTMAGSVLATYVYPGIPALAILTALALRTTTPYGPYRRWGIIGLSLLVPVLLTVGVVTMKERIARDTTQIPVIQAFLGEASKKAVLAYACARPHSAEFYGKDRSYAMEKKSDAEWRALLGNGQINYLVIEDDKVNAIPKFLREHMQPVGKYGKYTLFRQTRG